LLKKYSNPNFRKYQKKGGRVKTASLIPFFHAFVPQVLTSSGHVFLPNLRPELPWHVSLKCQKENQDLDVNKVVNQSNIPNRASCRRIWISGGVSQF